MKDMRVKRPFDSGDSEPIKLLNCPSGPHGLGGCSAVTKTVFSSSAEPLTGSGKESLKTKRKGRVLYLENREERGKERREGPISRE